MSDLDKKLREIILGDTPDHFLSDNMQSKPERVKQAFTDAGYVKPITSDAAVQIRIQNSESRIIDQTYRQYGLMTGREWYDRFIDEWQRTKKRWLDDRDKQGVIEAAKKAAGIE